MRYFILLVIFLLSGCFRDLSDLQGFMDEVKASTPKRIKPMPEIKEFEHFKYSSFTLKSPFIKAKPVINQDDIKDLKGCLHPDPIRQKQPLEKFALESLKMSGTLGEKNVIWALIEASDSSLHRVSTGSYLGLYNGRITKVEQDKIKIVELIPDGSGCWVDRETTISLVAKNQGGQL